MCEHAIHSQMEFKIEQRSITPENEIRRQKYDGLVEGLRNREDPVTWRTLIVDLRFILGSNSPEFVPPPLEKIQSAKVLIERLTEGTYMDELKSEILWGCFGKYGQKSVLPDREEIKPLDYLLVSARLKSQELLWKLADEYRAQGKSVAVIAPNGHFGDSETRPIFPDLFIRPVKQVILLSSTQEMDGGSVGVLNQTVRELRNPNLAYMIDNVKVVIPMFAGSRGHKAGQAKEVGYEVLMGIYHAKNMINTLEDIKESLDGPHKYGIYRHVRHMRKGLRFPHVSYSTVDIHNNELPRKKFREKRIKFTSLSPAPEMAKECVNVLSETSFSKLPKRFIACDRGSIERTEKLAQEVLMHGEKEVEIVYINKTRISAGEVADAKVGKVVLWKLNKKGEIVKRELKPKEIKLKRKCVLIFSDDMIDTGGTAGTDIKLVKRIFTNSQYTMFIATHPIFSKGVGEALSKMAGVDTFIVGNTLSNERFKVYKNIRYVNLAPTIARSVL